MKKSDPSKSSKPSSGTSSEAGSGPDSPGERSFADLAGEINGLRRLDSPRRTSHPIDRDELPARPDAPAPDTRETPTHRAPRPTSRAERRSSAGARPTTARTLRDLRAGKLRPETTIDLHGLNRREALRRLSNEVMRARSREHRCVLVIHGWGSGSPDGTAVLKQALPKWLDEPPLKELVLSSAPARPHDGGGGATYLLLRG